MRMKKNTLMAYGAALGAILTVAGPASAQSTHSTQQVVELLQQQILQLQQQLQSLSVEVKASTDAAKKADATAVQAQAVSSKAAEAVAASQPSAPNKDAVKLTETPGGYRLIDTETTTLGLFGLIDLTAATSSSGGPNANPNSATNGRTNSHWVGLDVSWMNGNRWGLTGSHVVDKGSNTELVFRLESEFELPTGNFDGGFSSPVLFNRDAWIGVQSPTIGKLTVGRQDTLGRDVTMIWANPFSNAKNGYDEGGWMNNQVMYQMMEYSGSPTGNRWDSAAVWKKKWGDNWVSYLGYQFGGLQNTQPGNGGTDVVDTGHYKGTQQAGGIGYNSSDDTWHASASITHANYDGFGKMVESVGGNIRPLQWLRLNGGLFHADIDQPQAVGKRVDNAFTVSAQIYPAGKFDYALAYYRIKAKNAGTSGGNTLQPFDLTSGITSAASGTWDTLYGAAFYRLDKQTDLYLAFDYSYVGGGYNTSYFNGNRKIFQAGLGARYFF
ncbi:Outer membrane protein (porin) [Collimonas sp. OK307]|nr:Outer membrane protein (porin) [Collimonas sp. OK307]